MRIPMGSFAEACFENNTVDDLEYLLSNGIADETDCREWDLTEGEYWWNIKVAINELQH